MQGHCRAGGWGCCGRPRRTHLRAADLPAAERHSATCSSASCSSRLRARLLRRIWSRLSRSSRLRASPRRARRSRSSTTDISPSRPYPGVWRGRGEAPGWAPSLPCGPCPGSSSTPALWSSPLPQTSSLRSGPPCACLPPSFCGLCPSPAQTPSGDLTSQGRALQALPLRGPRQSSPVSPAGTWSLDREHSGHPCPGTRQLGLSWGFSHRLPTPNALLWLPASGVCASVRCAHLTSPHPTLQGSPGTSLQMQQL